MRRLYTNNNIVQHYIEVSVIVLYKGVSKSFRTARLEREPQVVQLSATRCSCITILWVSLVSFAAITLCVASQWVFVVVYFAIDPVRKLLDTPSYEQLKFFLFAHIFAEFFCFCASWCYRKIRTDENTILSQEGRRLYCLWYYNETSLFRAEVSQVYERYISFVTSKRLTSCEHLWIL
jgi:hypothetical protein